MFLVYLLIFIKPLYLLFNILDELDTKIKLTQSTK